MRDSSNTNLDGLDVHALHHLASKSSCLRNEIIKRTKGDRDTNVNDEEVDASELPPIGVDGSPNPEFQKGVKQLSSLGFWIVVGVIAAIIITMIIILVVSFRKQADVRRKFEIKGHPLAIST